MHVCLKASLFVAVLVFSPFIRLQLRRNTFEFIRVFESMAPLQATLFPPPCAIKGACYAFRRISYEAVNPRGYFVLLQLRINSTTTTRIPLY